MGDIGSQIKRRILAGHEQATRGHAEWTNGYAEWVEGTLILAAAMKDGRDQFLADTAFGAWLKKNGLNFYNAHDRAALIGLGGNLNLARKIHID